MRIKEENIIPGMTDGVMIGNQYVGRYEARQIHSDLGEIIKRWDSEKHADTKTGAGMNLEDRARNAVNRKEEPCKK